MWDARYSSRGKHGDSGAAVKVSPGGRRVYVTGGSWGDYLTLAYNPVTGARLWLARYNGPGDKIDSASSLAVSPGGSRVFVTGSSWGGSSERDYATVAYDAVTGARLWVKRYNGPGNRDDNATSVAVGPGGRKVFVTGDSMGKSGRDYATVAYDAVTGARLWVARYTGGDATTVAVSPDGGTVFVTGTGVGATTTRDYATVAYSAVTGKQVWAARYNGPKNNYAFALAVSPGGGTVFVTGSSSRATTGSDYATVAYSAATGTQLWAARYSGHGDEYTENTARAVAVSPSGATVFVTGLSDVGGYAGGYATVAYRAATGTRLWDASYSATGQGHDYAFALAVSPGGGKVFVTGESPRSRDLPLNFDYATVAYRATGGQLWVARYSGPGNGEDEARALAVSPDGARVFVTGSSRGGSSATDYATVAYRS